MILNNEIEIVDLRKLDGFHNEVFIGRYDNIQVVVRVSKSKRRTIDYILSEIKFLQLLRHKVNVVEPLYISGTSVFEQDDKVISLFKYVEGPKWHELEHTDAIIYQAGKQLALIHKISSESEVIYNRYDYKEHNDIKLYLKNFSGAEFIEEYNEVISLIESISKKENYFLIHGDYLFSNIIYNDGLTIIDFDDCEYGYYIYDIAVYMFYYLLGGNPLDMNIPLNRERFKTFMNGYKSVRDVDNLKFEDLNPFFRLRQMKLMGTIAEYQGESIGEWQKKFISSSLDRIKMRKDFV